MSKGSGYYSDRLIWLQQSDEATGTAGAVGDSFEEQCTLWCALETPKGADKIKWSALQSSVDYIVRLRGNPGVRSVDRFKDPETDSVYVINGVHVEDNDQVCAVVELSEITADEVA